MLTITRRRALRLLLAVSLGLALSACGSDGTDGADGEGGTAGRSTLLSVTSEAAGSRCEHGGSQVSAGQDTNGNGVLDAAEVTSTQVICNGASAALLPALVSMTNEAPGANCVAGGKRVAVGIDANGDSVLDAGEVISTGYVCSGTGGANSLVAIGAEAAGANCTYGGSRITAGIDADGDGQLNGSEVTSTTYVCNRAAAGMAWIEVTGTAVQAEPNTGYIAHNDSARVTITLPAGPSFGDVVRVNGVGLGGWKIAQNAGQTINARNTGLIPGAIWFARDSSRVWQSLAASADGLELVAADWGGQLYTSSDGGVTWTARDAVRNWHSVAASADGSKLVAASIGDGVYTSTDSGITWTRRDSACACHAVASSADGNKLVAASFNGALQTSTDGGATWTTRDTARPWYALASSADGTELLAATWGGQLYVSGDSGVTWTARESSRNWSAVAASADGTRLVAAPYFGRIYTSADGGVTWIARGDSDRYWTSVASSFDGSMLAATVDGDQIYTSSDGGVTWTARASADDWQAIAMSSDGSRLIAGARNGQIHTSSTWTTPGPSGAISGGPYDAIALQYLGDGKFNVISYGGGSMTIR
jgi:hypothetical protein